MRTASPWIDAATFSFDSLMSFWICLPFSCGTPTFTVTGRLTLSPEIFSTAPGSSARVSTLRFASRPRGTSSTWPSLNSSSANTVRASSFCSTRASEPLKSKRFEISLLVCSTAFFTSCWSTCETMSKEGIGQSPFAQRTLRGHFEQAVAGERRRHQDRNERGERPRRVEHFAPGAERPDQAHRGELQREVEEVGPVRD